MSTRQFALVCAAALLPLLPFATQAQDKPAPPPIAKHSCKSPGDAPSQFASSNQIKSHRKELVEYRTCLTSYADQLRGEAQARILAANAAVEEYNQYVAKPKADDKN